MPRIHAAAVRAELEELAAGRSITVDRWSTAPSGLTGEELEEAEYDALLDAAQVAAERVGEGVQRVVISADVDRLPDDGPVAVAAQGLASLHVDETPEHSDEDLLWYDASELQDVIALL